MHVGMVLTGDFITIIVHHDCIHVYTEQYFKNTCIMSCLLGNKDQSNALMKLRVAHLIGMCTVLMRNGAQNIEKV